MTPDQILVLIILGLAALVFASDRLRVDVVSMMVLVAVVVTGLVTPDQALAGFASPAVITVIAVFMLSRGLIDTGVADLLSHLLMRFTGRNPIRITVAIMLTCGLMSAFMNNIGAVAILLPTVIGISRQTSTAPSKLLIPLAFSSLMGGNITAIGTPPNILANSILSATDGLEPFKFFDFTIMGILLLGVGVLYMAFVGHYLLPDHRDEAVLRDAYPLDSHVKEIVLVEGADLIGQRVTESNLSQVEDLSLLSIRRADGGSVFPQDETRYRDGDVLLIEGTPEALARMSALPEVSDENVLFKEQIEEGLETDNLQLAEVSLAPTSQYQDRTVAEMDLRNKYDVIALAIRQRDNRSTHEEVLNLPVHLGESVLVVGPSEKVKQMLRDPNFITIEASADAEPEYRRERAPLALAILVGTLVVAVTGVLPIAITMLSGALLMVLSGVISMDEAYDAVDWKAVFLIAGMLPLGTAMATTGTAVFLATWLTNLFGGAGPIAVMMSIYALTVLLTTVMSNTAVTVLVIPIALDTAIGLSVNPYTFVMAVVIAASTSFIMPIGHKVNVLVYGPGKYRFSDFARVGIPLTLIIAVVVAFVLPLIWPL